MPGTLLLILPVVQQEEVATLIALPQQEVPRRRGEEGSMRTLLTKLILLAAFLFFPSISFAEFENWNISVTIHEVNYEGTATVDWGLQKAQIKLTGTNTAATIISDVEVTNARGPYWIITVLYARCSFVLKLGENIGVAGPEEQDLFDINAPCSSIGGYGIFTMTRAQ